MTRVFNISGGLTSAFMVLKYYQDGDIVLNCDTEREHPKTYKFLCDFEAHENIPIVRLKRDGGWEGFLSNWNKGKNIPYRFKRECTLELKVRTARRYLRSIGLIRYENFIGFRYDEPKRVRLHKERWKKVVTRFPLYEDKITKSEIIDYWKTKPYSLEIPHILGNCDLCFMKGRAAIISILQSNPEYADKWINDEENPRNIHKHTYVKGVTMRQMRDAASKLGKQYSLDVIQPEYSCACTA